jgi:hypothetical protein
MAFIIHHHWYGGGVVFDGCQNYFSMLGRCMAEEALKWGRNLTLFE